MTDRRGEVLKAAAAWAAAIVANDPVAIGSFMAEDWIIVGANGATAKPDFLASVASGELTHDMMRPVSEQRIAFHGETAIVTARLINTGHYQGAGFAADEWTTDIFVRRDARWLCVLSHVTPAE